MDASVSWDVLIRLLHAEAGNNKGKASSVATFERWVSQTKPGAFCEQLLDDFRQDVQEGRFLRLDGKRYGITGRHAPTHVFTLFNRIVNRPEPGFLRELVPHITFRKFRRFFALTPKTQEALI